MRTPSRRNATRRPVALTRRDAPTTVTTPPPPAVPPTNASDGDGIRWELVAQMKDLIAADALDTPERWALSEELLLAHAEG